MLDMRSRDKEEPKRVLPFLFAGARPTGTRQNSIIPPAAHFVK